MKGTYFNGESARPVIVDLIFTETSIVIRTTDLSLEIDVEDMEEIEFSGKNVLHLQFGDFPKQSLRVEDAEAVQALKDKFPALIRNDLYQFMRTATPVKVVLIAIAIFAATIGFTVFVFAPNASQRIASLVPTKHEIVLGKEMAISLLPSLDINKEKTKRLRQFYETCGFKSDYPIELHLSDQEIVNAFAIPGGQIVIYQGIIDRMDHWEELAALIAHELAHVQERHSIKSLARSVSVYLVISIITSDISGISTVLVDHAVKLQNLKHSRSFETEADENGIAYLQDLGIDPSAMIRLFEKLDEVDLDNKQLKKAMRILSTHPLTADRISNLRKFDAVATDHFSHSALASLFQGLKTELE